jgi:hypothetical protein
MPVTHPLSSMLMVFVRIFWMMLGPIILGLLFFLIVRDGNGWFTAADFWLFAVLNALLLARWAEFKTGNALIATGDPAAPVDLHKYHLRVITLGLGAWVLANVVGNCVLPR